MVVKLTERDRTVREAKLTRELARLDRVPQDDHELCLTVMRRVTEFLLRDILRDHGVQLGKKWTLSHMIDALNQDGLLTRGLRSQAKILMELGNLGVHDQDEGEEPDARACATARQALDALLHRYRTHHLGPTPKPTTPNCPAPSTPRVPAPAPAPGATPMRMSPHGPLDLDLAALSTRKRQQAEAAARALRDCGPKHAATRGRRILADLSQQRLTEVNLISLSKWCYSGSAYSKGVEPAQHLSRQLFDGRILPELIDHHRHPLPRPEMRRRMQVFLTGAPAPTATPPATAKPKSRPKPPTSGHTKGSQHCLRQAVDTMPDELSAGIIRLSPSLEAHGARSLDWLSPLASEGYREHRDDYLQVLGLRKHEPKLRRFWPRNGPQWDGLARVKGKAPGVVLVEAKAHTDEMNSKCSATDPESLRLITSALERAQRSLGVQPQGSGPKVWMERYYQLANRLAFLRFMNEDLGIDTWLALVLFLDDRSHLPTSLEAWQRHITQVYALMDLRQTPLLERVVLCPVEAPH